ncbi:hypothetical protein [Paenibacillus psychroresistens]|nr:hypothetical protein [Paenibacillus psychroresistens]
MKKIIEIDLFSLIQKLNEETHQTITPQRVKQLLIEVARIKELQK